MTYVFKIDSFLNKDFDSLSFEFELISKIDLMKLIFEINLLIQ